MSGIVYQAQPLAPEALEQRFKDIASYRAAERSLRLDYARFAFLAAAAATSLLAGSVSLNLYFISHKPIPEPPRFIEVHDDNGFVGISPGAKDAPKLFNERVTERSLRDYITACMSYVPETYQLTVHQCAIMSAPEQQERLAAQIAQKNPSAPVNVYGQHGYAMPVNFHFEKRGTGKYNTLSYVARFQLQERLNNHPVTRWWTAAIDFQWHPELPMAPQDATLNEAGMQVLSFTPTPDPGQGT
jgi:type IV secretory pathway component VirB8